eukprot:166448_1
MEPNTSIFKGIPWKVKTTQRKHKLCTAKTTECINSACNITLYKGKAQSRRKPNAKKGFAINDSRGSLRAGHYVCLTVDSNDKCYLFDDNKYHECNGTQYKKYFGNNTRGFNVYMLRYTRRNTGNKRLIVPLANGVHDNADIGTNEAMNNQSDEDDIDMNEDVNNTESHHANENVDNRRYPLRSRGKPT